MIHDTYLWLAQRSLLSIPLTRWLTALLITVVGYALVMAVSRGAARRLRTRLAIGIGPTRAMLLAALEHTRDWLVLLLAASIGAHVLGLRDRYTAWLTGIGYVVAALQLGLWAGSAIRTWTQSKLAADADHTINPVVLGMLGWTLRIALWAILLLWALAGMHVNITAFVASLGVGGVAVALALQNILGDLFASMSIGLDKPFEIGQSIAFGNISGVIEHVGVKTTRIRSVSGEQVIISNSELLKNTVHNYARMTERRIVFGFGVTFDTDLAALRELPGRLRAIIEGIPHTRVDRAHFKSLGESSLDFEVVYYVTVPEYGTYMDIQQAINLALMEHCASAGIEFAFPSRTLYVAGPIDVRQEGVRHEGVPREADDAASPSAGSPSAG